MKQNNLLKKKRWFVKTTNSNHPFTLYPNLTKGLTPTKIDQLWVCDITYIRLPYSFVYLTCILDAYSRKVIGWNLGSGLGHELTVEALRMALVKRNFSKGLIHHSGRGVQYASNANIELLKNHGIKISMSAKGNPYENAKAESFFKTLKCEEVYLSEYETMAEARVRIGRFVEDVYNKKRLHSSLGYLLPNEFEGNQELVVVS